MKKISSFFFIFAMVFIASCKKDVANENIQTTVIQKNLDWNETSQAVAKDVSVKLNSLAFRKMLKHEV